ncbi:MAG: DNA-binding protein [bacterium]
MSTECTTIERSPLLQTDPDALMNEEQAAAFLKFTPRALQMWRHRGGGPQFVKISSRAVRYRKCDLLTWVEERLRRSTSDNGERDE